MRIEILINKLEEVICAINYDMTGYEDIQKINDVKQYLEFLSEEKEGDRCQK